MGKWVVGIVVAAIIVGGGAYYGLVIYPQNRFQTELDAQLKRLPQGVTANYKTAQYSVTDNRATVGGVTVHVAGDTPVDMTVDEIDIAQPALDFPAALAAAQANPATLTPDTTLPVAKSLVLKGITTKISVPNAPAVNGTVASLQVDGISLRPGAHGAKGDLTSARNIFAMLRLDRIAYTGGGVHLATDPAVDETVDSVELVQPSFDIVASWLDAQANPSVLTQDTALPVAKSMSVKGVSVKSAVGNGSLGGFQVDGFRLYPWAFAQTGIPGVTDVMAIATRLPQAKEPPLDDLLSLLRLESAFILCFAYDRAEIDDLTGKIQIAEMEKVAATTGLPAVPPTPAGAPVPTEFSFTIHKETATGIDRGVMAEAVAEGVSYEAKPQGSATVDRMVISGLEFRKPMIAIASGAPLALDLLDGIALNKIEYNGMKMQVPGMPPVILASFSISQVKLAHGLPVSAGFAYNGFHVTPAQIPDPKALEAFQKLGIDALTVSLGAAYQWDPDKGSVAVRDTIVKVDELGALKLTAEIVNVTPSLEGLQQARLAHAVLRYDDASLADRGLKMIAKENGADPDAFRQQMIAVVYQQGAALGDAPAVKAGLKAVAEFLGAPKSLTIELSPPKPLDLATLQGVPAIPPPQLITLLGLAVTSNR